MNATRPTAARIAVFGPIFLFCLLLRWARRHAGPPIGQATPDTEGDTIPALRLVPESVGGKLTGLYVWESPAAPAAPSLGDADPVTNSTKVDRKGQDAARFVDHSEWVKWNTVTKLRMAKEEKEKAKREEKDDIREYDDLRESGPHGLYRVKWGKRSIISLDSDHLARIVEGYRNGEWRRSKGKNGRTYKSNNPSPLPSAYQASAIMVELTARGKFKSEGGSEARIILSKLKRSVPV